MAQSIDPNGYDYVRDKRGDNDIDVGDGGSTIITGRGDDTITAGDGYDYVNAGKGDNVISVGDGGSYIISGRGDDIIVSEDGYDVVRAGSGDNSVDVGDGGSFIQTGSGDDTIRAGEGYDRVYTSGGDNDIDLSDGGAKVYAGNGNDTIRTGDGWDFVNAGHGENQIDIGSGGGMVISGRHADDVTLGSSGYSFVHTGSGDDTVTYVAEDSLYFSRLYGGNGQDTLVLDLPLDLYKDPHFQAEIAYFLEFKAPAGKPFYFCSLNLYVHSFEAVEIVVDGVPFDPVDLGVTAAADTAILREDDGAVLQASVLDNDATPNGFGSVALVSGPDRGALALNDDGTYTFDPAGAFEDLAEGETTEVTFTYEVSDIDGDVAQAEVTITIIGDNDTPFLAEGSLVAAEDGSPVSLDLSALGGDVDSDDDGASLTYAVVDQPAEGTVEIDGTTLIFTPGRSFQDLALGESRDVTVTVTATDQHGAQVSADYTITVSGTNDGPEAVADTNADDAVVEEGSTEAGDATAEGNVLSNDSDVDTSDTLEVASVAAGGAAETGGVGTSVAGTYGVVTIAADGSYIYTLDNSLAATDALAQGEVVTDVFTYEVSDGNGGTASATLTISITGSEDNRPPVAQADAVTIGEADIVGPSGPATVAFNLLADNGSGADSDPDGDALTVQTAGGAPAGTSFSVTTASAIAAFSGLTLTASVAANGDVSLDTQDAGGAFLFNGLAGGQSATVTFDYTIADPSGETSTASATITIVGTEDAPEISGATTANVAEDTALAASGVLVVTDADLDDTPEFTAQNSQGAYGTFDIAADGSWSYALDNAAAQALAENETVDEVFTVTATTADGESVQTSFTVTVKGQEDAPIITGANSGAMTEDTSPGVSGTLVTSDEDAVDTPAFVAQAATAGTYGTFSIGTDGNWSYSLGSQAQALRAGQAEVETFSVTAETADGETVSTTVTINVTGTNDAPIAEALTAETTENVGTFAGFENFVGGAFIPNSNFFYAVDLDTGEITEIPNTLSVFNQANAVAAYAPTNGLLVNVNPNSNDFEIAVIAMVDGVATNVDVSGASVTGTYDGATDSRSVLGFEYFQFTDSSDGADINLTLPNAPTASGPADVTVTLLNAFFTDDLDGSLLIDTFGITMTPSQDPGTVTVTASFTDADQGDTHSFTVDVDTENTNGAVTNNGDGTFTYSTNGAYDYLAEGEQATDVFEYTVDDGQGGLSTESVTITITGSNDAPVAAPGSATVEEAGSNTLSVLPLVTELDTADQLSYFFDDSFLLGSIVDNGDGTFDYDPSGAFDYLAKGETAEDVLVYVVEDGQGGFTFNTFTITIEGTNELPEVTGSQSVTTDEDAATVSMNLLANASDANGDAIDVSAFHVTTSDGRPVAFTYDSATAQLSVDPGQFGDLGVGESLDVLVSYNVIESDRTAYSGGDSNPRALTNPGTFYISDLDGEALYIVERGVNGVSTYEQALSYLSSQGIADVTNGVAMLIDENGGPTSGVAVGTRLITDGKVSVIEAEIDLAGYTGSTRNSGTTPPTFTTFYDPFDETTLTVTISVPDLRCGPTEHTFTFANISQEPDKDVTFDTMSLDVAPVGVTVNEKITINGVNDAPEINSASVETEEDTAITFDLVADATDEEGDTVTVDSVTQGTNGTVSIEANGTVTYTPDADWYGEDSFTYTATDGNGGKVTETVTVTVNAVNDAPVANNDTNIGAALVEEGLSKPGQDTANGNLLSNDTDVDGDTLQVTNVDSGTGKVGSNMAVTAPLDQIILGQYGSLVIDAVGNWTYTLNDADADTQALEDSDTGVETFTYTISDGNGGTDTATLTLEIEGSDENALPVANDDQISLDEDTPTTLDVLDNDTDADGQSLSVVSINGVAVTPGAVIATDSGAITVGIDGSIDYTPDANFYGEDTFNYVATDGLEESGAATVTLTVNPVNDDPVAENIAGNVDESGAETVQSASVDTPFVAPNAGRFWVFDFETGIATSIARDSGSNNTYQQIANQYLSQGNGVVTSVNPNNTGWGAGTALFVGGTEQLVDAADYTITDSDGGGITQTPGDNAVAFADANELVDSIALSLRDIALDDGRTVDLDLSINGLDYEFFTTDDVRISSVDFAATVTGTDDRIKLSADFTDVDTSDTHTYSVDTSGTVGRVTDNGDGTFTYDADGAFENLAAGEMTTDTFTYTVDDGNGGEDTATTTVTITGQNDDPNAGNDNDSTNEDSAITINIADLLANDSDIDATDVLNLVSIDDSATSGTITDNGNGTLTYDPNGQFEALDVGDEGTDSFSYSVSDGNGGTATATVTIRVDGAFDNAVPAATDDALDSDTNTSAVDPVTGEDTAYTIAAADILSNDSDGNNDTLTISSVGNPSTLGATITLNGDGSVSYDPTSSDTIDELAAGETIQDSFTYTISDGNGGFDSATVTLVVSGMDDPPILTNATIAQSGFTDEAFMYELPADLFTDHDEGEAITYAVSLSDGSPLPSFLSFDATTRTISYDANVPQVIDVGLYTLLVTATEPDGQANTTTFTLTLLDGALIEGTSGNDNLGGTIQGDLIRGLGGNDTLTGLTGADVLDGGDGNDRLDGNAGDDVLIGGDGNDNLSGDEGNDNLFGGDGADSLFQDAGFGTLDGGDGNDRIYASTTYSFPFESEVLIGGEGDDFIYRVGFYSNDIVDGGAGDDYFQVYQIGSVQTEMTLGAGFDRVEFLSSVPVNNSTLLTITDFNVNEDVIEFDNFLSQRLTGWDGASNPFGSGGFLRLQNIESDVALQVDTNGGGDNFISVILFEGLQASAFTGGAFDSPWPPDGSSIPGLVINGTSANDIIDGTLGGDTINGLDGFDRINGGAGDDSINGGDDRDSLYGNAGNDILIGDGGDDYIDGDEGDDSIYGGAGNDNLRQDAGAGLLDGGDDNDTLYASTRSTNTAVSETLVGGDGDDFIYDVGFGSSDSVDAGDGNDLVEIYVNGGNSSISYASMVTLGTGADRIQLDQGSFFNQFNAITVTDFDIAEDTVVVQNYLEGYRISGWDGTTNPFAANYLRLGTNGSVDAILEVDYSGTGSNFQTAITFQGVSASAFSASNFVGAWDPLGTQPVGLTINGTANSERLDGDSGGDQINGLGGNDQLYGYAGNDTMDGGDGFDNIYGGVGNDSILGGDDRDNLYGQDGNDTIYGGEGDDYIRQDDGMGLLDGGIGNDRIDASYQRLTATTSETLVGGTGNDTINGVGYYSADIVDAGADDDRVVVRLQGYSAATPQETVITLGTGSDTLEIDRSASISDAAYARITDFDVTEDVVLFDGFLSNRLTGWDGASNPFGSGYVRLIDNGSGDALFQVDQNGGGDNYVSLLEFTGLAVGEFTQDNWSIDVATNQGYEPDGSGVNGNLTSGTSAGEALNGFIGDDNLSGLGGNDTLTGGAGADILDGGADNDRIIGGFGNDAMTGGTGTDVFVFAIGEGDDIITDFDVGVDALVLSGTSIYALYEVDTGGAAGVDGTLVEFADGSSVFLKSVLNVTDFNDLL